MARTDRSTLKAYFEANKIPTEEQFGQLIDSGLNMPEDHIFKNAGEALSLEVGQPAPARKTILNLHETADTDTIWSLELNPADNGISPPPHVKGLSITDNYLNSRLFIQENQQGQVGISTIFPKAQLHVANPDATGVIPDNHGSVYVTHHGIRNQISLELGKRGAGNLGSIRLNSYDADQFGLVKTGQRSLELDSSDGIVRMNHDQSMHAGREGQLLLYAQDGALGVQLTSDNSHSYFLRGNVGIGTAHPAVKLDVNGWTQTNGITSVTRNATHGSVADFNTDADEATYVNFWHKDKRAFYIQGGVERSIIALDQSKEFNIHAPKVGINRNSPDVQLDVNGVIRAQRQILIGDRNDKSHPWMNSGMFSSHVGDFMYVGLKDVGHERQDTVLAWGDDISEKLQFLFLPSNAPEKSVMTLLPSGKVGINNENPIVELDLNGEIKAKRIHIDRPAAEGNGYVATLSSHTKEPTLVEFLHKGKRQLYIQAGNDDFVKFHADAASRTLFTGAMVGINHGSPQYSLDVGGDVRAQRFRIGDAGAPYKSWMEKGLYLSSESDHMFIGFKKEGHNRLDSVIGWGDDAADKLRFIHASGRDTEIMTLQHPGYVGINRNVPEFALDVAGEARANRFRIGDAGSTKRPWMEKGMYLASETDHLFLGFKKEGNNRLDSVISWGDDTTDKLRFIHNHSVGHDTEVMTLQNQGYVGINDSSPEAPLTIGGVGKWQYPNGNMHITPGAILFGGRNTSNYEVNSGQISAGLHKGESLNFIGMGTSASNRRMDFWSEGNFNVYTNNFKVQDESPIIFQRYNISNAHVTSFKHAEWNAAVVGFRALGGDVYEGGNTNIIQVFMKKNHDFLEIWCDFASHGSHEVWQVDIMYVSKRMSRRIGGTW